MRARATGPARAGRGAGRPGGAAGPRSAAAGGAKGARGPGGASELPPAAVEAAAARLRAARRERVPCAPLTDLLPVTAEAGYAVQDVNTERALRAGRRLVGRKIGLTSAAVRAQLGVHEPDYGMLFADRAHADGEPVPAASLLQPRVEAEIAFVLGRDLAREGLTEADVARAIDHAVAAIEVVDSAVRDWDISILDTVADNASAGRFVLGAEPRPLRAFDARLCDMVLERRGEVVATGAGAACLGSPLTAALWLAKKMVAVGRPLRAGDVVLSGALGPLAPAAAGDVFEARIGGLGAVRAVFG
ncbi:MAG TPA: fumarylacetoacetate hydrolase family protein [Polyangiaceae bacterium]|nr:fumarylacetoacetate hydrolase family protein [Polyangiaceae bacterium]